MITEIEDYFTQGCGRCARFATPDCSIHLWAAGLKDLRRICRAAGLAEVVKWGHPTYMHEGRNIAIIGAFRSDFRLTFFEAALLSDPKAVLEKQGPNTATPDCLRFTDPGAPGAMEPLIRAYLAEAMEHAAAGRRAPKPDGTLDLPPEFIEALDTDIALAEAFRALTPGRQKSWALQLADARTAATRIARIEKARPKILSGKGAHDR
jgi:uncharacterized protein YdeI (YjbR/CyaY-like superfamily)